MAAKSLRVRSRNGIVTRYDLIDQKVKRMVGRKLVPHPEAAGGVAWVSTGEAETVPNMKEFRDEIRDGGLWAADEETAREVWPVEWRQHLDLSFGSAPQAPQPQPAAPTTTETVEAPPSAEEATR